MSSFRSHGTQSSSPKKPSLPVRFIKWTAFQMISFVFAVLLLGVGYAAWTTLSPSQGASGQPVNQTLVQGIINNINDLDSRVSTLITNLSTLTTRVATLEVGATTGGTVTGPLRWSSEYGGGTYSQAWTTCLGLTPTNMWRLPIADEIEYGRQINSALFSGAKTYYSSSPLSDYSTQYFLGFNVLSNTWKYCSTVGGCYNYDGSPNVHARAFRCVSNAN